MSCSMNRSTSLREILKTSATAELLQFGMRSQITFGGLPHNTLRSWKSESFETIVKPCDLAFPKLPSRSLCLIRNALHAWSRHTPPLIALEVGERDFRQKGVSRVEYFKLAFPVGCERKASTDICFGQIRKFVEKIFMRHPSSAVFEHIVNGCAQPANTRLAAAFPGLDCDLRV